MNYVAPPGKSKRLSFRCRRNKTTMRAYFFTRREDPLFSSPAPSVISLVHLVRVICTSICARFQPAAEIRSNFRLICRAQENRRITKVHLAQKRSRRLPVVSDPGLASWHFPGDSVLFSGPIKFERLTVTVLEGVTRAELRLFVELFIFSRCLSRSRGTRYHRRLFLIRIFLNPILILKVKSRARNAETEKKSLAFEFAPRTECRASTTSLNIPLNQFVR